MAAGVALRVLPALLRLLFSTGARQASNAGRVAAAFGRGSRMAKPTIQAASLANKGLRFAGANAAGAAVSLPIYMGLDAALSGSGGEGEESYGSPYGGGSGSAFDFDSPEVMDMLARMENPVPRR